MAGVDVGGARNAKRPMNAEINMIPFIDLLMVTVAFLLVTAVWVSHARLDANAATPQRSDEPVTRDVLASVLDVRIGDDDITLAWRRGNTVVSERKVARSASTSELANAFEAEWRAHGEHTRQDDRKSEEAVLHSDNRLPFKDLVAVMDAMNAPRRSVTTIDGRHIDVPVYAATFSVR